MEKVQLPPRTGFLKLSILISNVSHSGCDYVLLLLHLLLQPPLQKLPYQILRSWTCFSGLYILINSVHVRQSSIHALRTSHPSFINVFCPCPGPTKPPIVPSPLLVAFLNYLRPPSKNCNLLEKKSCSTKSQSTVNFGETIKTCN